MARSSAGSTWRRQEQVNGCSPSGSGSRPRAGVPGWERGRAPASPEASAGRLTGPGSGRRPAPALARADLHLRGPEWRGNFACRPRRSRRSGGTEVPSRPRFPPAPSGAPLPVSAIFRQRRQRCAQCESSGRAGHVTRPRRRVGFPHLAECATSVYPAGGRVCTAAASGGSFAALHASRLLLQHLWAAAAPVLSALGSAEAPQCSPHSPNSDFFLHCVDTDIASAPIFATRVGGWLRNTFACCVVEGLPLSLGGPANHLTSV